MASVMHMRWNGVTKEQYDELRPIVQWETEHPDGAIFHVAYFDDGGINVIDVWESPPSSIASSRSGWAQASSRWASRASRTSPGATRMRSTTRRPCKAGAPA